jgi:hypothetical protein
MGADMHTDEANSHEYNARNAASRPHAIVQSAHGAGHTGTAHDVAMHQAVQRGKKGGTFVLTASGKRRYIKR